MYILSDTLFLYRVATYEGDSTIYLHYLHVVSNSQALHVFLKLSPGRGGKRINFKILKAGRQSYTIQDGSNLSEDIFIKVKPEFTYKMLQI